MGSDAVEEMGAVSRRWGMNSSIHRVDTCSVEEEDSFLPDSERKRVTENRACSCAKTLVSLRIWLT